MSRLRTVRFVARRLVFCAIAAVTLAVGAQAGDKNACPMNKVTRQAYCKNCDVILGDFDKECDKCHKKREECPAAEVCERSFYGCRACSQHRQFEMGMCPKCGTALVGPSVESSLVHWHCGKCGESADKPGKCASCKKPLKKTCKASGSSPHCVK